MRTTKKVGEITLKNGEMLQITEQELVSLMQSKMKSGMGDMYFASIKRMLSKPYIVDMQEKWVEDKQQAIVEERSEHLLAGQKHVESDGTGPGYKKFMAMRAKFGKRYGKTSLDK